MRHALAPFTDREVVFAGKRHRDLEQTRIATASPATQVASVAIVSASLVLE
jgi:hypothetical protein